MISSIDKSRINEELQKQGINFTNTILDNPTTKTGKCVRCGDKSQKVFCSECDVELTKKLKNN